MGLRAPGHHVLDEQGHFGPWGPGLCGPRREGQQELELTLGFPLSKPTYQGPFSRPRPVRQGLTAGEIRGSSPRGCRTSPARRGPRGSLLCTEGLGLAMGVPWRSCSRLTFPERQSPSSARLGPGSWAGSDPPLGPQPWSRVGAQTYREPTHSLGMVHHVTASSASPGPTPLWVRREGCSPIRVGQESPESWAHLALGVLPEPAGRTSIQRPAGLCKQSGKGLAQESSRKLVGGLQEAFDGSRHSQAATWLVGHRVRGDPEAGPE